MWLFLSNAYLSIVAHTSDKTMLRVRARAEEDITRVFPDVLVQRLKAADYLYHADVSRSVVAHRLMELTMSLDYTNFKNSVPENDRHNAYLKTWSAMRTFQEDREFGPRKELDAQPQSMGYKGLWTGGYRPWQPTPLDTDAREEATEDVTEDNEKINRHLDAGPHTIHAHSVRRHLRRVHGLGATNGDPVTYHDQDHQAWITGETESTLSEVTETQHLDHPL